MSTSAQRKTIDTFEVQGNYGYGDGWECVTTELTMRAARVRGREYSENEPGVPFRVKLVREPLAEESAR